MTLFPNRTDTVEFQNYKRPTLKIYKVDINGNFLTGAIFEVKTKAGVKIGDFPVGPDGSITVSNVHLEEGYFIITEKQAPEGYILDPTPHEVYLRPGTLIIRKFIEGTENEPLSGVAFKVVDGSGAAVGPDDGTYYTDKAGEIVLEGIEPGTTVIAREIKTVDGFVLDGTPQDIKIEGGRVQQLTFWNKRAGTLLIEKLDSVTKAPLAGAQFKVLYADGRVVDTEGGKLSSNGIYITDSNGQIKITNVTGTLVVTEEKAPDNYVIGSNDKSQTVVVNPQDTQTLRFYNDPIRWICVDAMSEREQQITRNTKSSIDTWWCIVYNSTYQHYW